MEEQASETTESEEAAEDVSPEEWMELAKKYAAHVQEQNQMRLQTRNIQVGCLEWERIYELGRQAGLNEARLEQTRQV